MNQEIVEFKKRWALVNAAESQELRSATIGEKARQTAALRWNALRKAKGT